MSEYRAIYKCRLCGEEYIGGRTGVAVAMQETAMIACVGSGKYGTHLYGTHNCEDGAFGLSDFYGFRRVDEE